MVYGFTPELKDLNGKCLMCYFSCLMTTSWMSFLWLNVLAFDIWSALSTSYNKNQGRRFNFYCLYAFGLSILICLLIFILHKIDLITLEYQHKNEIERHQSSQLIDSFLLTYLPIIYTVILNIILFSTTGYMMYKTQIISIAGRPTEKDQARFDLIKF